MSNSYKSAPLSSLGASPRPTKGKSASKAPASVADVPAAVVGASRNPFVFYLFGFIIIVVVVWIILYSMKPGFVLRSDGSGEVDTLWVLLWSVIFALVIIALIALIRWGWGY